MIGSCSLRAALARHVREDCHHVGLPAAVPPAGPVDRGNADALALPAHDCRCTSAAAEECDEAQRPVEWGFEDWCDAGRACPCRCHGRTM